jgi:hypothetical protein
LKTHYINYYSYLLIQVFNIKSIVNTLLFDLTL